MADDSQLEQIEGEIRDHFRALANGFQKLDKIKDPNRQSKQLEELTGKMRECKRLIKEYDREIKDAESGNPPDVNKELNEKKQSMIKELNSYVALRKTYTSSLGNKRVELFDMGAGSSDPAAEDNLQMASKMSNQELIHAGTKAMDETDQAIENSKKVVEQTIEPTSVVTNLPLLDFDVPCQHMSHSLLVGEDKLSTAFWKENPKTTKAVAGLPQSTLCEVGSWSGCSNRSSRASLNGPSQVSSPPTTTMDQKDDAWDLLYAAAGQVMRMKMNEQGLESHGQGLLGQPRKPVPVPVSTHMKTPNSSYYSDDAFAHFQLQHNQFQILRRQQFMRQQLQNRSRASGFGHGRCGRSSSSFCANPPHHHHQQQQGGSGMRAIFLEGSGSKRESVGTGVFLPRRVAVLLNFAGRQLVRPSLFLRELSKL